MITKKRLATDVSKRLRELDMKKSVNGIRHVLHVSDDVGNEKDFYIKTPDRAVQYNREDVEDILDLALESIAESLERGEEVGFLGFGTFRLTYVSPRIFRNPITGENVLSEPKYVAKFKPGKALKLAAELYTQKNKDIQAQRLLDDMDIEYDAPEAEDAE